jgi:xylulokinase
VHTRAHLIRSILEGVAFSLRDSIEILAELKIPISQIRASGGGSRSPLWREIQASIYRKEVVTLAESEGSAFGAALLAGVGYGVYASVQEAVGEIVTVRQTASPVPKTVRLYDELYQVYRRLYPAVRELAHQLGGLDPDAAEMS